jgi:lipopolysaccharide biosynthesis protein
MLISDIRSFFSKLNKRRKEAATFVSKRRYTELLNKYNLLKDSLLIHPSPLFISPTLKWERSYTSSGRELCLFVTFSKHTEIKSYVASHIKGFLKKNVDVVLIINTENFDQPIKNIESIPEEVAICVRENKGFDFGAWSQVMSELDFGKVDRLYWVNDSIYGPLNDESFNKLIDRVRNSKSDFIGLTFNNKNFFHLQSYFLVFNKKILKCDEFYIYMKNIMQLPIKSMVIEFYEIRLTQFLKNLGFNCEPIYELKGKEGANIVYKFSRELVEIGFPYVKTRLVRDGQDEGIAAEFLPQHLPIDQ